jgi:AcrR family transcriptional regulator
MDILFDEYCIGYSQVYMAYRQTEKTKARQLEVRQAIINATLELLINHGFSAVSIRAVADLAGLAIGSVYKHFACKADLCADVFRLASEAELARLVEQTKGDGSADRRLLNTVKGFCDRAIKQPKLAYALLAEPVDPSVDELRIKLRQDYANAFAELIREGVSRNEFAEQSAKVSAAALVGIISETLVAPLSWKTTEVNAQQQSTLILSIQNLCLRAVGCRLIDV